MISYMEGSGSPPQLLRTFQFRAMWLIISLLSSLRAFAT